MDYIKLIGKVIKGIKIDPEGQSLEMEFTDETVALFDVEGDCCSHSWIESIDNEELRGAITNVQNIEMPDLGDIDGKRYQGVDHVRYYGLKITTDQGHCVIDYRNDSNGYYGGSIRLRDIRKRE